MLFADWEKEYQQKIGEEGMWMKGNFLGKGMLQDLVRRLHKMDLVCHLCPHS
jgi:hypothetical protein